MWQPRSRLTKPCSGPTAAERVVAVFDAAREWAGENSTRGCSMVNAHAEISDPQHPAYAIITGQKAWMPSLLTGLAREADPAADYEALGRTLLLLHEGALVTYVLNVFPDALSAAREQARSLLAAR